MIDNPYFFDRVSIEARNAKANGRDVLMVRSREFMARAEAMEYLADRSCQPHAFRPARDRPD
ncbi:hypothetical protein [Aureimonas sp. D3]|uniref:hypothetical protein n=1 Tax=Aureimonas sp. D3 TaxID=1638164 RepID=UPI0007835DD9|nr:hypothetical protein [Aureimonas sp. D3]